MELHALSLVRAPVSRTSTITSTVSPMGAVLVGTPAALPAIAALRLPLAGLGREGHLARWVDRMSSGRRLAICVRRAIVESGVT